MTATGLAFGWDPGGGLRGRGPRAGRGDVRIAVLTLLGEEPMHGYQIMRELARRSGGMWRPSAGSIYPTLQQLEDEGLVASERADGRHVYQLTDAGREELERRRSARSAPWEAMGDAAGDSLLDLRRQGFALASAVMQVAEAGTAAQVDRARSVLSDARARIYAVLADDSGDDRGANGTGGDGRDA